MTEGSLSVPKRLVIFVEGRGDIAAVPVLARRVVNELGAHDALFVDPDPFRVAGVAKLLKTENGQINLHRWLTAAGATRQNVGGVLLVLDGDMDRVPPTWATYTGTFNTTAFCAFKAAAALGHDALTARAGQAFSLASVFAMKEFEAWLLAGVESLRGKQLAANRGIVPMDVLCPDIDVEQPRDAKGRLRQVVPLYDQSLDQGVLASAVDLKQVQLRCRSFRRFCSAIRQLSEAVRANVHVVTPTLKVV